MTDIKVDRYFIEKELSSQEDSSDFLDWLDGRDAGDGEADGFVTFSQSTCISEDELRNKISKIETTPDRRKEIWRTITKFVPTCEKYLKEHEVTRRKSLNKTPLTRRTPIGPKIIEEDRVEAFHGPEEGFFFVRVDVPYFKVKGMVSFTDTRGIFSKAARTTKRIHGNNGNSMKALLGPLGIAPSTVAELSAMAESSAVAKSSAGSAGVPLLFAAAALATGLTPQSFRIDLQLIIPKIKIGQMTIYVKVPKPQEVVIEERPGRAQEILINSDGTKYNTGYVEEKAGEDRNVWVATKEGDPKHVWTPTEGVNGIKNSGETESTGKPANASGTNSAANSDVDDDESPPADTKELAAGETENQPASQKMKPAPQLVILDAGVTPSPDAIEPVQNARRNPLLNKPEKGGFWTSTVQDGSAPSEWTFIAGLEGMITAGSHMWKLTPPPDTKIYHVDSADDFRTLMEDYTHNTELGGLSFKTIDFEALRDDNYDGLHVTRKAINEVAEAAKLDPLGPNLYGWDTEQTLWFRWVFEGAEDLGKVPEKYTRDISYEYED